MWVLPNFDNVRQYLATPNDFAKVLKLGNNPGLWDAKFAWYSPSAVHCIRLFLPTPPLGQDMKQGQFLSGV